jgi:hypothetical protein
VEIAMLLDAEALVGIDALAQADLGSRQNRHQPLRELGAMAFAVLCAVERRIGRDGGAVPQGLVQPWDDASVRDVPVRERPPMRDVIAGSAALRNGGPAARTARS